jgi:hypothetical protein
MATPNVDDYVAQILATAKPLTDEQRTRLAELLRPARLPAPEALAESARHD